IPDLEMVVQLFPYDRKLRNLRLVLGGALHDLDPQLLARLAPGEWRVTERTMAPTRYRTELGAALKYTLQARDATTGRAETLRCFVKVYRNDHGEPTFELLKSHGERAERGATRCRVVRPSSSGRGPSSPPTFGRLPPPWRPGWRRCRPPRFTEISSPTMSSWRATG